MFYRPEDFAVTLNEDERIFITKHGPIVMGLERVDDGCMFLKGNLCSINEFKPGVCRAFPFQPKTLGDIDGPFGLLDDPCGGRNDTDEIVPQKSARSDYKYFIYDYYDYIELVQAWNADVSSKEKDIEDFLRYVGLDWWRFETKDRAFPSARNP